MPAISNARKNRWPGSKNWKMSPCRRTSGLSAEVVEKLKKVQPRSLGQALRISGVTPAAVSILQVHLKRIGKL